MRQAGFGLSRRMKISLCVIAGNEAPHVDRFLETFAPIIDELCLVRAIGNQTPDETADKAKAWAKAKGVPYRFSEYINAPGRDWPHVDNFAAARQAAFDLANPDHWRLWLDFDDVMDAEMVPRIRDAANLDADMVFFKYELVGQSQSNLRERLIRPNCGRWKNAIHENFYAREGAKFEARPDIIIKHAPRINTAKDEDRNTRIISAQLDGAAQMYYHLAREYAVAYSRAKDEQAKHATAHKMFEALNASRAIGGITREEESDREILACCIYRDQGHAKEAEDAAWRAHRAMPDCRRPYMEIAESCLARGDARSAIAFARAMTSLPKPPPSGLPTDSRPHGWHGMELLQRCNRAVGFEDVARASERTVFEQAGRKFSLLHATRGRPKQALAARNTWLSAAGHPASIEHIFAVDADDAETMEATKYYRRVVLPGGGSCVAAWNAACSVSDGHVIVQLSDDWWPCVHWDLHFWQALAAKGNPERDPMVLAINDGHRTDALLCMAIATRTRIKQQEGGHLFHPEYNGMFSDNEFTSRAYRDGVVVDAREIITCEHRHPAFGKSEVDATYQKQNASDHYQRGMEIYNRRNLP
jgi:hypothetical protein